MTTTWPAGMEWRQSPWDQEVHAFPELGEVTSEAVCEHCAPTARLVVPMPGARTCLKCLLRYGGELLESSEGRPVGDEAADQQSLKEITQEALARDEPGDLENAQEALQQLKETREKESK